MQSNNKEKCREEKSYQKQNQKKPQWPIVIPNKSPRTIHTLIMWVKTVQPEQSANSTQCYDLQPTYFNFLEQGHHQILHPLLILLIASQRYCHLVFSLTQRARAAKSRLQIIYQRRRANGKTISVSPPIRRDFTPGMQHGCWPWIWSNRTVNRRLC